MLFEGYGVDHLQCQLAPMRKTVNELMDTKTARLIGVTFTLLCAFWVIFIIGLPKSFIGLAQRLAEASMFLWQFWVAILGIAYLKRSITCVSYLVCVNFIYINTVKGKTMFQVHTLIPEFWCLNFEDSLHFYTKVVVFPLAQRRGNDLHAYLELGNA